MNYIITITTTDEHGNITTTEHAVNATDARTAHNAAAPHAPRGATVNVYPDTSTTVGLMRGAVMVARRTAINAIKRQGTPTQQRIEQEYRAINARLIGAESPDRVNAVLADYSADTQDFYGYASLGLQEGIDKGMSIADQYNNAYLTLNHYINSQRAATAKELSTEYLTDGGGDIVEIGVAIASIIRGGDKWTPAGSATMDKATAARMGQTIKGFMAYITPTQRKIVKLIARGYSQRQIADKMGREVATVNRNIAITRGKIAEYLRDNAPEFSYVPGGHNGESTIDASKATAAAQSAENNGRTAAGRERKTAQDKATQAERARRYRERKAAERAAKKGE